MRLRRLLGVAGLGVVGSFAVAPAASAHPLGNFTRNAAAVITIEPGNLRVDYAIDLAEIPTFQSMRDLDANGDGVVDATELDAWAASTAELVLEKFVLQVNGHPIALRTADTGAALEPGQGGLRVLRFDATFDGVVPGSGSVRVVDRNDAARLGWREISVSGTNGIAVTASSVPTASLSDHLRRYPTDLLSTPPDVREARFEYGPGSQVFDGAVDGPRSEAGEDTSTLGTLVSQRSLTPPAILLALFVAFGVGALHALAPGHGKTIAAAYLVGGDVRMRDAARVGLAVAAMHSASVIVLGLVLVTVARAFPAERLYPWMGVIAGTAAIVLGGGMLLARLRHRVSHRAGHGHEHPHEHPVSRPGLVALALSGGLLPSPTAVIVLLASFSLGRAAFGLSLVTAFGLGLATALTAVGALAMRARNLLRSRLSSRFANVIPMAGAGAITTMGLVVAARAISQL